MTGIAAQGGHVLGVAGVGQGVQGHHELGRGRHLGRQGVAAEPGLGGDLTHDAIAKRGVEPAAADSHGEGE